MKVAITAASGQLGTHVVTAMLALTPNANIVGLARTPDKAKRLGIEIRPGDYNEKAVLEESLQSVDAVLLVSGMDAPDRRIEQHRNVIEAARSAGVKKVVYTSVQGAEEATAFSPIIQSNRQTEEDVRRSGLAWAIGRNGIDIEPDVEYLETYRKAGGITNCAGDGRCGYTTRSELAYAYARLLTEDKHDGHTYNLHGQAITQYELADYLNSAFGTDLTYTLMTVEDYRVERVAELGEFVGTIIAGIYQGIRDGKANNPSQYLEAAGREHVGWPTYFASLSERGATS